MTGQCRLSGWGGNINKNNS